MDGGCNPLEFCLDYRSPNHNERRDLVDMLLLHYTNMSDCLTALRHLCDEEARVSAHYVIDEDGTIYQLVLEDKRAWHAGQSFWRGNRDINSCSIGIEMVNGGHAFGSPDFTLAQMTSLKRLASDIIARYDIAPIRVLGHSDVAPKRKRDPGEKFDWAWLAHHDIGVWLNPQKPDKPLSSAEHAQRASAQTKNTQIRHAQTLLKKIGYDPEVALDILLTAFQRHYRPQRIDGVLDGSTMRALEDLAQFV